MAEAESAKVVWSFQSIGEKSFALFPKCGLFLPEVLKEQCFISSNSFSQIYFENPVNGAKILLSLLIVFHSCFEGGYRWDSVD